MKDFQQHEHICPDCLDTWACHEAGKVWDQEDSDCRWHTKVVCPACMKKRTFPKRYGPDDKGPHDIHREVGELLFGKDKMKIIDIDYASVERSLVTRLRKEAAVANLGMLYGRPFELHDYVDISVPAPRSQEALDFCKKVFADMMTFTHHPTMTPTGRAPSGVTIQILKNRTDDIPFQDVISSKMDEDYLAYREKLKDDIAKALALKTIQKKDDQNG
jgi:hypothetical protein